MRSIFVHITSESGHRASYRDLFVRLLGGQPSTGSIFWRCFWRLISSPNVFFATIDDDYLGFVSVAIVRSILRKPTIGLFLRPLQCFRTERPIIYPIKRFVFRNLLRLPRLRLLAIIPHDIRPELAEVSHDWIHDPQMWDLWLDGLPLLPDTELSQRIDAAREGRKVMVFIGGINLRKGFDMFLARAEADAGSLLYVSAGRVSPECAPFAARLKKLGMMVEDRFVTDDEILSLYKVANYAWCYYAPDYDQASGVFGRALQTGIEPVVREGSVLSDYIASLPPQLWGADLNSRQAWYEHNLRAVISACDIKSV